MKWAGNSWVDELVCPVCYQPECFDSFAGARGSPGAVPSKLEPGKKEYRGYGEWAVHPDEASTLLHRGYALVGGEPRAVTFIHNEAFVTQVRVEGTGS